MPRPAQSAEIRATRYLPDTTTMPSDPTLSELEQVAMDECFKLAEQSFQSGNPPVGAVLIDSERGLTWGAYTDDKTTNDTLGHAELRAYAQAAPTVGNKLEDCTLLSTAQPCTTCTPPYAEGKIGRIVFAAPRSAIFEVSGIMRPRNINLPELIKDGDTDTVVIEGYREEEALALFGLYRKLQQSKI